MNKLETLIIENRTNASHGFSLDVNLRAYAGKLHSMRNRCNATSYEMFNCGLT